LHQIRKITSKIIKTLAGLYSHDMLCGQKGKDPTIKARSKSKMNVSTDIE
jgi:hypothetical protein